MSGFSKESFKRVIEINVFKKIYYLQILKKFSNFLDCYFEQKKYTVMNLDNFYLNQ